MAEITITVTDQYGNHVSQAEVGIWIHIPPINMRYGFSRTTDENGEAVLEFPIRKRFRVGIYEVWALARKDEARGKFGTEQPPYLFFEVAK